MDLGPGCSVVTRLNTHRDEQASAIQSPPLLTLARGSGQLRMFITLTTLAYAQGRL